VEIWRVSNGPGAAPMVIGVRMELEPPNWSEQLPDWSNWTA
jgi:hypothetical protein